MKRKSLMLLFICYFILSCNKDDSEKANEHTKPVFQNKAHELVYEMTQKAGTYHKLSEKNDVIYTYTYQMPNGKKDVSTEKYLFDGELSYGKFNTHERTFPDLKGDIEQSYDGKGFWLKNSGEVINDPKRLKRVAFGRPTNFYWFTMFQKLLDPGLKYEYVKETTLNEQKYDVVKVTFEHNNDKPKDVYQLYINKESSLVDQFLFTVAEFGIVETPKLMRVKYEEVDGLLIYS